MNVLGLLTGLLLTSSAIADTSGAMLKAKPAVYMKCLIISVLVLMRVGLRDVGSFFFARLPCSVLSVFLWESTGFEIFCRTCPASNARTHTHTHADGLRCTG